MCEIDDGGGKEKNLIFSSLDAHQGRSQFPIIWFNINSLLSVIYISSSVEISGELREEAQWGSCEWKKW